ncbi:MAG: stage V sporulation protein AC [Anaerotignum sp.]|nr:stage V sporulation protein AC [Anaerotignum sp.]MBR5793223.1 stage V sporulation protein AC [Anaerotignum sp.]
MVKKASPNSPVFGDCIKAFVSGGIICTIGQLLLDFYIGMELSEKNAAAWVSITLVGLSALLTALGIYEKLGKFCGAGTIVPITGFANSVVSPAIEFKKEGMVFGMAAKMFVVAGPVIVYGTLTSMLVGFVYYFVK